MSYVLLTMTFMLPYPFSPRRVILFSRPPRIFLHLIVFSVVRMGNRCSGFAHGSLRWWYPSSRLGVRSFRARTAPYHPPPYIFVFTGKTCEADLAVVVVESLLRDRSNRNAWIIVARS